MLQGVGKEWAIKKQIWLFEYFFPVFLFETQARKPCRVEGGWRKKDRNLNICSWSWLWSDRSLQLFTEAVIGADSENQTQKTAYASNMLPIVWFTEIQRQLFDPWTSKFLWRLLLIARTAANLSSTKIYSLGTYHTHWRIYGIHSQRHFYGRSSEEANQPGVLRAHGKCRDNSGLVYMVYGILHPAKVGFKCLSPRWVLPHQVKARLLGKRGVGNKVWHCLRLLFFRHRSLQKKRVQWSWVRVRMAAGAWPHRPETRVVMEGKVLLLLDFLPLPTNFRFPCLQWHSFNCRRCEGLILIQLAFGKHKNQLQVCELHPRARCMKVQQNLPDLHVFVDLDLVYCLYI